MSIYIINSLVTQLISSHGAQRSHSVLSIWAITVVVSLLISRINFYFPAILEFSVNKILRCKYIIFLLEIADGVGIQSYD